MGLLRLLFLPEIHGVLRDVARALGDVGRAVSALAGSRPCETDWRRAFAPGRRIGTALGLGLVLTGATLTAAGIEAFFSAAATAQSIEPGMFSSVDNATRTLLSFLADVADGSALGDMLFAYNGGILALAAFLLLWHMVAGTVDTAREGRWGFGGWEIVRIVAAVALMAPLPGGLNAAQYAVTSLARLGGDFANAIWQPFSDQVLGYGAPVVPGPKAGAWRTAIARTLLSETCLHVANAQAAASGDAAYVRIRREDTRTAMIRHYDGAGRGLPGDLCGRVSFDGVYGDSHLQAPARGILKPGPAGLAAQAHRTALISLLPAIGELARDLGDHFVPSSPLYGRPLPDPSAALENRGLAVSYRSLLDVELQRAATEEQAALRQAAVDASRDASWLSAASFFNTIASRTGRFQSVARAAPAVALPLQELGKWSPQAAGAVAALTAALANSGFEPVPFSVAAGSGGALPRAAGSDLGLVNQLFKYIDLSAVVVADSGNPIVDLAGFGHSLVNAALLGIGALASAAAGTGVLESVPVIGRGLDLFGHVWQVTDAFVSTILGLLLIAGIVLAYVLPAIPFLRFLFGILAWLIQVIAALLAATVFCAAHVSRGDGNRITTQATQQGWLFLPALILRPPLMLFGLILGYFLFSAVIELFNTVWLPHLRDTEASDGLGPIGFLTYLALYVMTAYALVNACFKLIDFLPNAVMNWIGSAGGAGEDDAGRLGTAATGGIGRLSTLRVGSLRGAGRRQGGSLPTPPTGGD